MKFLSLFSGIGGMDLGLERAGWQCLAQVEVDDYANKILEQHFSQTTKFRDVRGNDYFKLPGTIDAIVGGFPCQDISVAGKRAGLAGERSGLWSEFYRAICTFRPKYIVIENVPALLSPIGGGSPNIKTSQ